MLMPYQSISQIFGFCFGSCSLYCTNRSHSLITDCQKNVILFRVSQECRCFSTYKNTTVLQECIFPGLYIHYVLTFVAGSPVECRAKYGFAHYRKLTFNKHVILSKCTSTYTHQDFILYLYLFNGITQLQKYFHNLLLISMLYYSCISFKSLALFLSPALYVSSSNLLSSFSKR